MTRLSADLSQQQTTILHDTPARPVISIGIPTYNRREYLMNAVCSALAQTYENIEVIISDNASSDDTWEHLATIQDVRVRLVRHTHNIGMTANFNSTLDAATGEFFLLLSDDDLLTPTAIEELSAPFRSVTAGISPDSIGVCWCPCTLIDGSGAKMWDTDSGEAVESSISLIENLWLGRRGPRLASVLLRTADARRVGGYDDHRFGLLCDTANWGQAAVLYPNAVCIRKPLVQYRVHASSGTGTAVCLNWQQWGDQLHDALLSSVRESHGRKDARIIKKLRNPLLANLTADVVLRGRGGEGWWLNATREFWKGRRFMLTPYVAGRVLKDGWKLVKN